MRTKSRGCVILWIKYNSCVSNEERKKYWLWETLAHMDGWTRSFSKWIHSTTYTKRLNINVWDGEILFFPKIYFQIPCLGFKQPPLRIQVFSDILIVSKQLHLKMETSRGGRLCWYHAHLEIILFRCNTLKFVFSKIKVSWFEYLFLCSRNVGKIIFSLY